jgi:CBS domain-containing protein
MNLADILNNKGRAVFTVPPTDSLASAVRTMVEHNCGSLVVCDNDQMVGILSERDILKSIATTDRPLDAVLIGERMTRNVITGNLGDDLNKIMGVMTRHRIRHLPVLEDGKVVGMISIGDIVKAHHDQLAVENHFLLSYIQS